MLNAEDEKLFREWEANHLDQHHQKLPLWQCDPGEAMFAALALHDSIMLMEALAAGVGGMPQAPTESVIHSGPQVKAIQEGVSQALRWLLPRLPSTGVQPTSDDRIVGVASEFVSFAQQYVHLSDLHKLYGRSLAEVRIERTPPSVTFTVQEAPGATPPGMAMAESTALQAQHVLAQRPESYKSLFKALTQLSTTPRQGRLELSDLSRSITSANVDLAMKPAMPDLPEISPNTQFNGFTLGQFDRVWAGLWLWSFIVQLDYVRRVISREKQHEVWPTQVNRTVEVVSVLSRACGVDPTTTERILRTLALDSRIPAPDIWLQPLVFGNDTVAWSARTFIVSRPRRNLLRLLARTGQSNEVADAVGQLAAPTANRFAAKLQKYGFVVATGINISNASEAGEMDLVAWSKAARNQLLVVECKGSLPPDEVAEVKSITDTANSAKGQLLRCFRILDGIDAVAMNKKCPAIPWREITSRVGLIVFYDGTPDHGYSHKDFPVTDLPTILRGMRSRDFNSPMHLANAVRSGSTWEYLQEVGQHFEDVVVEGVTYRIPVAEVENTRG